MKTLLVLVLCCVLAGCSDDPVIPESEQSRMEMAAGLEVSNEIVRARVIRSLWLEGDWYPEDATDGMNDFLDEDGGALPGKDVARFVPGDDGDIFTAWEIEPNPHVYDSRPVERIAVTIRFDPALESTGPTPPSRDVQLSIWLVATRPITGPHSERLYVITPRALIPVGSGPQELRGTLKLDEPVPLRYFKRRSPTSGPPELWVRWTFDASRYTEGQILWSATEVTFGLVANASNSRQGRYAN